LPANPRRGHAYVEHRHVINGILWRLGTGARWGDIPARYGAWQTCYDRFVAGHAIAHGNVCSR
jgi:transposase